MKEIILVEENDQFNGVMSAIDVFPLSNAEIPPETGFVISVGLDLTVINSLTVLRPIWNLNYSLAAKGLSITGFRRVDDKKYSVVIHNSTEDTVNLNAQEPLAEVWFMQPIMIKGIDSSKTGVIDLNLGVGEGLEDAIR